MDFNTHLNQAEAYRLGQRNGAVLGIFASAAAYYLFKAYKPNAPFRKKTKPNDITS